ncbi:hypothetical protein BC629DRAFT_1538020 [Irpex lacteus]|nr:hypothetical protein BC629DRAFT_1538020 [Irpex lacteus]
MASEEVLNFNPPHAPHQNAIEAFNVVLPTIKSEIIKSRHHWDKHEPKMWSRAAGLSDHELTAFTIEDDLVEVRSAATSYGNIILGKIRIPAVKDAEGEGFVHVRIHDPPNRVSFCLPPRILRPEQILTLTPRVPRMCDSTRSSLTKATAMPRIIQRLGGRFKRRALRSSFSMSRRMACASRNYLDGVYSRVRGQGRKKRQ